MQLEGKTYRLPDVTTFINQTQTESLLCCIVSDEDLFLMKLSGIIIFLYVTEEFDVSGGLDWTLSCSLCSTSRQADVSLTHH